MKSFANYNEQTTNNLNKKEINEDNDFHEDNNNISNNNNNNTSNNNNNISNNNNNNISDNEIPDSNYDKIRNDDRNSQNQNINNKYHSDKQEHPVKISIFDTDNNKDIEISKDVNSKKGNAKKKSKITENQNDLDLNHNEKDTDKYIVNLNDYSKIEYIGSGSFGSVYLIENKITHKKYAAKINEKKCVKHEDIYQEIHFYTQFKYPMILSFHGYSKTDFDNNPKPMIILEYMPKGSLDKLFKDKKFMRENKPIRYIILIGIINAMQYLHHKGIVHRDLKPGNILIDENYYPRVGDFGSSIIYREKSQLPKRKEKRVGTPLYIAPEILLNEKDPYSYKVDVYSFSMIAYQLLTGNSPYYEKNFKKERHVLNAVVNGVRPDLSIIPDAEIAGFLQRCWSSDPLERPNFEEIRDYFTNNRKIQMIFGINPQLLNENLMKLNNFYMWLRKSIDIEWSIPNELLEIEKVLKLYPEHESEFRRRLKQLSDKGNKNAMYRYALYLCESTSPADKRNGNIYLKRLADIGEEGAMVDYANNLVQGKGITSNYKEAVKYYKKAADCQNMEGLFNYAYLLSHGKGIKKDERRAVYYYQLAADLGDVNGCYQYALMLHKGKGVRQDCKKAEKYYKKAIFMGDVEAMVNYSTMLRDGSLPVDLIGSKKYSKMAADLGNEKAMFNYANTLILIAHDDMYDTIDKDDDIETAAEYFKKAADMGNIEAGTQYGTLCACKSSPVYDIKEATRYLKDSAYKGSFDAIVQYGVIVSRNHDTESYKHLLDYAHKKKFNIYDIQNQVIFYILLQEAQENDHEQEILKKDKDEDLNIDAKDFKFDEFNEEIKKIINMNIEDKFFYELIYETCLKYGISSKTAKSMICTIGRKLSNDIEFSNDKKNIIEENITADSIFQMIQNFISKKFGFAQSISTVKAIHKNINEVNLKTYEVLGRYNQTHTFLFKFSFPKKILNEIQQTLKEQYKMEPLNNNIVHPFYPNDLCILYDDHHIGQFVDQLDQTIDQVLKKYEIKIDRFNITSIDNVEILRFYESMIPEDILIVFYEYLKTNSDIVGFKRNLYNSCQIATFVLIKKGKYNDVINSINKFLTSKEALFKTYQYPLINDIIINEKMVFEDPNDFNVILNELQTLPNKPINVERDALYIHDPNHHFKLFEKLSFICYNDEIGKMEAANHINSNVYKGKTNVLQYNVELHYASVNEYIYPKEIRELIPKIFKMFKGVEDIQRNVVSIESPYEKTYIGFDNLKHLKKCHYKFIKQIVILLNCSNAKLFWRVKNLKYAYIVSPLKFERLLQLSPALFIAIKSFTPEIQEDCTEPGPLGQVYLNYFGFKSLDDANNFIKFLSPSRIPIKIYKEGRSLVNITDQSKEAYLFYDCF